MSTPININIQRRKDDPTIYYAWLGDGETYREYEIEADDWKLAQEQALSLWAADDAKESIDEE